MNVNQIASYDCNSKKYCAKNNQTNFGQLGIEVEGAKLVGNHLPFLKSWQTEKAAASRSKQKSAEQLHQLFKNLDKKPAFKAVRESAPDSIVIHASRKVHKGGKKPLSQYNGAYELYVVKDSKPRARLRIPAWQFENQRYDTARIADLLTTKVNSIISE